jgi:AsmA protein
MKKLLKIIGALVALILVVGLAAPMFISADFIKAQLTEQVKKATGRTLEIKGAASIKLLPNIAVKVEDVTLGNPAGFKSAYLVHIGKLETGAALKPLLNKELRITGVTLEDAVVNLEETAAGAKNWEFKSAAKADDSKQAEPSNSEKSQPLKQLAIGTVTIKNTSLTYDKAGSKPTKVEALNLALDGADGAGPLKLVGDATLRGEKLALALNVKSAKDFLAGKLVPTTLGVTLPSGKLDFNGEAGAKGAEYGAAGKLQLAISDVAKLSGWASGKPAKAGFPRSVKLAANVKANGVTKQVQLDGLSAQLDALNATGALKIAHGGAVPSISGELSIPALDLDDISGGAKAGDAGGAQPSAPAKSDGWSDAPIDASGLRAANANLKLAIGKLTSGKVQVADIAASIALNGGKLNVTLGNASLYGGVAKGTVGLDGSGAGAGFATNLTLTKIDIEALMTAMSGASKLKGTATLGLNINGHGASQRAIVSSLGGNGSMKINDGAIKGINIASFLRDAKKGFIFGDGSTESTDFTEMTATFKIAQGIVSNDDLSMKSPVLRLAGKGTISLPPRTINYRAVPTLVGTLQGQGGKDGLAGLDVPLLITGPWSKISVTPDLAGALDSALKNPEALKQNIKGIKDTIGDLNSPKDIGKALLGIGKKEAAPVPENQPAAPASATPQATPAPAPKTKEQQIQEGIGGLLNTFGK